MPLKGKGPLRIATEDFIQTFVFNVIIDTAKKKIVDKAKSIIMPATRAIFGDKASSNISRYISNILDDITYEDSMVGLALMVPMLIGAFYNIVTGALFQVPSLLFTYAQNRIFEPYRADISSYIQMIFRQPGKEALYKSEALDLGINSELWESFKELYRPQMTPTELIMAFNRKVITDATFRERLKQQGWKDEAINAFANFREVIPPITDLIRFMVREAFSEDIVAKFGYDNDFPAAILEFTRQLGLKDDWVKRYWRSHWDLPSASQGYEMLHRLRPGKTNLPFTRGDLDQLLRANDVPGFYRQRLMEISYHPLTRVDIRRMRQLNILDYNGVKDAYLDGGYNEDNATRLADFVEKEFGQDRRELSRSLIERGYDFGMISRDEAKVKLVEMGYGDAEADYILRLVDLRNTEDDIKDGISLASERYLKGLDNIDKTRSSLVQLGLTSVKVDAIITKLERARENDERFPGLADFKKMYAGEVISETELREELKRMNFSEKNIGRLVRYFNAHGD